MEVSESVIVGYIMMRVVLIIIAWWLDGGKCVAFCETELTFTWKGLSSVALRELNPQNA